MVERVLITGARAPAALELARSFAAAGFEAHMADCSRAHIARWSRTPAGVHRYAPPRRDPERFARDVAALVARLDPVLIVPACEEVFHLAALAVGGCSTSGCSRRPRHPGAAAFQGAVHRGLPRARLPSPAPGDASTDDEAVARLRAEADLVFKPEFSRFGAHGAGRARARPILATAIKADARRSPGCPAAHRGEDASFYAVARGRAA